MDGSSVFSLWNVARPVLITDSGFSHYLMQHNSIMERENSEMAECFYFYLAEQGSDEGVGLNDSEHKKLIREQFSLDFQ